MFFAPRRIKGQRRLTSLSGLSQHPEVAESDGLCPGRREAFKAARRGCRLQYVPLPDRDQHRSTLSAQPVRGA